MNWVEDHDKICWIKGKNLWLINKLGSEDKQNKKHKEVCEKKTLI